MASPPLSFSSSGRFSGSLLARKREHPQRPANFITGKILPRHDPQPAGMRAPPKQVRTSRRGESKHPSHPLAQRSVLLIT